MPEPEPLKQPSPAVNSSVADDISLQNCGHLYGINNDNSNGPEAAESGSSQERASEHDEHDSVSGDVGAGAETTMPEPDLNPKPAGEEAVPVRKPIPPAFQPYDSFFSTETGDLSEPEDTAAPSEQPVQTSAAAVEQADTIDVSWREDSSCSSGDSTTEQDGEPGDRGNDQGLDAAGENSSTSGRGVSEQEPATTHADDVSQGSSHATEQEQAGSSSVVADTGDAGSDGSSGGSSSGGSSSDSGSGGIRGVRRSRQQSQIASALLRNGTVRSHLRSQQSSMSTHNAALQGCAAVNFTSGSSSSSGSDAEDGSGFEGTIHETHAAVVGEGSLVDENMPPLAEFSSDTQASSHPHTSAVATGTNPMVAAFQPTTTSGVQPPLPALLAQGDASNLPWYPVPSSDKSVLPPKSVVKKPTATGGGGKTGFSSGRSGGGSSGRGRGGGGSGSGGDDGDMRSDGEEDSNRDPRWHVDHFNRWAAIGLAIVWLLYVAGPVAACAKAALRGVATVGKAFGLKVTSGLKDLTAATGVAVGEGVSPGDPTHEQGREAAALAAAGSAAAAASMPGSSGGGSRDREGVQGSKQEKGRQAAMAAAGGAAAASAMSAAVAEGVKAAEQSPGTVATAVGYAVVAVKECGGCDGQDDAAAVGQELAVKEEQKAR